MNRANLLFIFILALAVAGCHLNQQKEVARYRKILDEDAPQVEFIPGAPLALEQAMALANQHNERLGLRGEDYLQALIAKDRAAAAFLPTINLVPIYFKQEQSAGGFQSGQYTDVPLAGDANLFRGFSDVHRYQSAEFTIAQRRAILLDSQATVLLD